MKRRATRRREAQRAIREAEKSGDDFLSLSNRDVEGEIPSSVGRLKALRTFRCESAELHSLPEEFANLRELRLLCLNQNQIRTLSREGLGRQAEETSIG